jgi:hypothetical protein
MSRISLVLALASPLLHARLRAEIALDPAIEILFDSGNPARIVEETVKLRPPVLLVDREMILAPALADLARQINPLPAVVMVTVYKEGVPVGHMLPIAGSFMFDTRPGDISRRLNTILNAVRAEAEQDIVSSILGPIMPELGHRFTISTVEEPTPMPVNGTQRDFDKRPVPSKTSQLAKTGFLRSVFDRVPSDESGSAPAIIDG